jgi:hypothetical protein
MIPVWASFAMGIVAGIGVVLVVLNLPGHVANAPSTPVVQSDRHRG